jgi:flavodoxin
LDRIKGNGKTVTIISRTAAVWERIATRLHFEEYEIMCIKRDNPLQCEDSCRAMFNKWLEGKGRQPTNWDTVIKALEEVNLGEVAQDLKDVLGA